jgi:hypothetical protein
VAEEPRRVAVSQRCESTFPVGLVVSQHCDTPGRTAATPKRHGRHHRAWSRLDALQPDRGGVDADRCGESVYHRIFIEFLSHTDSIGNERYKTILTENKPSDLFGF